MLGRCAFDHGLDASKAAEESTKTRATTINSGRPRREERASAVRLPVADAIRSMI
jgi:hypothetical protein